MSSQIKSIDILEILAAKQFLNERGWFHHLLQVRKYPDNSEYRAVNHSGFLPGQYGFLRLGVSPIS